MKHVIKEMKKWYEDFCNRRAVMEQVTLDTEAREQVQIMEHNGQLYVSVDGVPLFGVNDFKCGLMEAVVRGREMYKDWKEEQQWQR